MQERRGGFTRPAAGWFILLDGGIVVLTALAADGALYERAARWMPLPSRRTLGGLLAATVVIHAAEARHAYRAAVRAGTPAAARWALQTAVVGFPSLRMLGRASRSGAVPAR